MCLDTLFIQPPSGPRGPGPVASPETCQTRGVWFFPIMFRGWGTLTEFAQWSSLKASCLTVTTVLSQQNFREHEVASASPTRNATKSANMRFKPFDERWSCIICPMPVSKSSLPEKRALTWPPQVQNNVDDGQITHLMCPPKTFALWFCSLSCSCLLLDFFWDCRVLFLARFRQDPKVGTGKRGHYERGLFAGGISKISKTL